MDSQPAPVIQKRAKWPYIALGVAGFLTLCCAGLVVLSAAGVIIFTAPTSVSVAPTDEAPTPHIMGNPNEEQKYFSLAQGGLAIPIQRPGLRMGLLPDAWKVDLLALDDVQITMPLSVGTTNEQTVRLGKVAIGQVTKALFDNAPELERVSVIGTTPDGPDGAELPAISIVVERAAFAQWDGTADTLGPWQVSERLQ
jgi:hypothetical protein